MRTLQEPFFRRECSHKKDGKWQPHPLLSPRAVSIPPFHIATGKRAPHPTPSLSHHHPFCKAKGGWAAITVTQCSPLGQQVNWGSKMAGKPERSVPILLPVGDPQHTLVIAQSLLKNVAVEMTQCLAGLGRLVLLSNIVRGTSQRDGTSAQLIPQGWAPVSLGA